MPGYEDAWYYLWRERRLPVNVDPLDVEARRPEERARLARSSSRASTASSATRCRCARANGRRGCCRAARGSCARDAMYLMPGDSPMGYRLPLDSLPWVAPATTRTCAPRCASSRATGGCTSSCRRATLEDYLDLVAAVEDTPPPRKPGRARGLPAAADPRCSSSRSRPTPA
jgi:uncharacterized protein (DUF2126 family)